MGGGGRGFVFGACVGVVFGGRKALETGLRISDEGIVIDVFYRAALCGSRSWL